MVLISQKRPPSLLSPPPIDPSVSRAMTLALWVELPGAIASDDSSELPSFTALKSPDMIGRLEITFVGRRRRGRRPAVAVREEIFICGGDKAGANMPPLVLVVPALRVSNGEEGTEDGIGEACGDGDGTRRGKGKQRTPYMTMSTNIIDTLTTLNGRSVW